MLLQRFLERYGASRVIKLMAKPYGTKKDRIPLNKLVSFYETWGFTMDDSEDLYYEGPVHMTRQRKCVQAIDENLADYRSRQIRKKRISEMVLQ